MENIRKMFTVEELTLSDVSYFYKAIVIMTD